VFFAQLKGLEQAVCPSEVEGAVCGLQLSRRKIAPSPGTV